MPRNTKTFDRFTLGPRSYLVPGDKFRATKGPVYKTLDGDRLNLGSRGLFVFVCYCERGASKWIEARRVNGGTEVLYVGRPRWSRVVSGLRLRPHKLRKAAK